jgi:hypothetical protein
MFVRPNAPGRDVDVNTALELQRNKILQEQNELIHQQMVTPQRPVYCTTVHSYGVANTTCYWRRVPSRWRAAELDQQSTLLTSGRPRIPCDG